MDRHNSEEWMHVYNQAQNDVVAILEYENGGEWREGVESQGYSQIYV